MPDRPELKIGRLYRNTNNWKNKDDEFNYMFKHFPDGLGIQNVGGFRYKSKINQSKDIINSAFVLLVTNFAEHEWPDSLDSFRGVFTYYGDNRVPGKDIENTHIGGNRFLSHIYKRLHVGNRESVPPMLCFEIVKNKYVCMKYLGLAAPGSPCLSSLEDLTAVWRLKDDLWFQNYKALFTILNQDYVSWNWLDDLVKGLSPIESDYCPEAWVQWVENGFYDAYQFKQEMIPRAIEAQLPSTQLEKKALNRLLELSEIEFMVVANNLLMLMDNRFTNLRIINDSESEEPYITGLYEIGHDLYKTSLEVFVEVKYLQDLKDCVKSIKKLTSKLKKGNIGVILTTSAFNEVVQKELIQEKHDVVLISGGDIVKILIDKDIYGLDYEHKLMNWIQTIKYEAGSI